MKAETEARLRGRIQFLEGQLGVMRRMVFETAGDHHENLALRRREKWLEQRVNDLEMELGAMRQELEGVHA